MERPWQRSNEPPAGLCRNSFFKEDEMKLLCNSGSRWAFSFIAVTVLLSGPMALNGCSGNAEQESKKEQPPTKTAKGERKILYWRAPMDPTYTSNKPGKSPMGMDLIPVYEGEEQTGGPTVIIDPVTIQNMGVQTVPVRRLNLHRTIRAVGYLDYSEEKLQRVNIKFSGWVEKLYVDETGQHVRKGQPMLSIYSPDLVATQEEYLLAYRNAKRLRESSFADVSGGAESMLASSRRRLAYWDITENQIRGLEEKGAVSKTVTLYAPSNGVVVKKMVEQGMRVMPGMDLYQVADLSRLWVYGQIYQYEVPFVKVGQPVDVRVSYIPGTVYRGKVDFVYPFVDEKTRNVNVRIVVPNPRLELKPQMYATVEFQSSIGRDVTAIPSDAVIRTGMRNVVFVARGGGKFEPRDVELGPVGQNSLVQVLSGVTPGENVVTSAQFMIDSESRLKEAIQKMLEMKQEGVMQAPPGDSGSLGQIKEHRDDSMEPDTMDMGSPDSRIKPEDAKRAEPMKQANPEKVIDPVCHMSITPHEELSYSYRGTKYYFCSEGDMEKFKADPEKYVHPHDSE
jgi:RND family efflux transporter MFP subunit